MSKVTKEVTFELNPLKNLNKKSSSTKITIASFAMIITGAASFAILNF
jgi:hypothetical protein